MIKIAISKIFTNPNRFCGVTGSIYGICSWLAYFLLFIFFFYFKNVYIALKFYCFNSFSIISAPSRV